MVFPTQPVGTSPLQYRMGFQQASHFHISIYPVRLFTNHRTGLLVHIPYGILLPTTVSHIPENRTGLFFPPYGTIPFGRFKRHFWEVPIGIATNTVRYLRSRLSHHFLGNFSAVFQHEIVLTFEYETLVTLCFSSDFPALALSPPVHTHTVRDFQPILWNRTVFLFQFFAYRTGCKNLKNQKSPQRKNLIPSRKKFYLLNQLCSFRCAKVRKE